MRDELDKYLQDLDAVRTHLQLAKEYLNAPIDVPPQITSLNHTEALAAIMELGSLVTAAELMTKNISSCLKHLEQTILKTAALRQEILEIDSTRSSTKIPRSSGKITYSHPLSGADVYEWKDVRIAKAKGAKAAKRALDPPDMIMET